MPKADHLWNTRPAEQASSLSVLLRDKGWLVANVPVTEIKTIGTGLASLRALDPRNFQGMLFSSLHGVETCFDALDEGAEKNWLGLRLLAVGLRVSLALEKRGATGVLVPTHASLQGLLEELSRLPDLSEMKKERWLHPCSRDTRLNPQDFANLGIQVQNHPVYSPEGVKTLRGLPPLENTAGILFCAGSAVRHFAHLAPKPWLQAVSDGRAATISIGGPTSNLLRERFPSARILEAPEPSLTGLVAAAEILKGEYAHE